MLGLFEKTSAILNISKQLGKLRVDNGALKLHYRVTGPALLAASIIVTAQQFIGDRISCIQSAGAIPEKVLNTYCFFVGTTTWDSYNYSTAYPHRGIGPEQRDVLSIRHMYYQWVSYYLFFLSLLFYSGHFIWKALEKKRLSKIVAGMETVKYGLLESSLKINGKDIPSIEGKQKKIDHLAQILWTRIKHDLNNDWTMKLILVEVWAFVLVMFVFWLTDVFLGGKGAFTSMTMDSAFKTFPTETSCIFFKYGPSGTIQRHDALCILATNIVNVYIFFFFYIWMLILIIISSLALVWRFIGFFLFRQDWFNRIIPFNHINSLVPENARKTVYKTLSYFDWVFLNYVSENTSASVYQQVFLSLADLIKNDYGEMPDEEELKPLHQEHGKELMS